MDRYLRGFGLPREKKQEVPLVKHASLVAIVSFHMSALVPLSAVILLVYLLSFTTIFYLRRDLPQMFDYFSCRSFHIHFLTCPEAQEPVAVA